MAQQDTALSRDGFWLPSARQGCPGLVYEMQTGINWLTESGREKSRAQARGVPTSLPGQRGQPVAALPCPQFGTLLPGEDVAGRQEGGWQVGLGNGGGRHPTPARERGARHVARKGNAGA